MKVNKLKACYMVQSQYPDEPTFTDDCSGPLMTLRQAKRYVIRNKAYDGDYVTYRIIKRGMKR